MTMRITRYIGASSSSGLPEVGTMAALNSAAEGHYRISVLGWQVREQVAGRVPTDEPPANVRREFVADAYGRVLADLHALPSASPYLKAVEGFRAEALASIPG